MPRKVALIVATLFPAACTAWVVPVPMRALHRTAAHAGAPGRASLPLQAPPGSKLRIPPERAAVHRCSAPGGGDAEALQETVRRLRTGMCQGPLLLLPPPLRLLIVPLHSPLALLRYACFGP